MFFLPSGAGSIKTRGKISNLTNRGRSQLPQINSYPRGTTSNCKQPYSFLTGAQYQTYLPHMQPHTNKKKVVSTKRRLEINGGAQPPVKIHCSWSATRRPPCVELTCPKRNLSYMKSVSTEGHGTAIQGGGE